MNHINNTRSFVISLAIILAGCASEENKTNIEPQNDDKSQNSDSITISGAAFEWEHENMKDCAAQKGTYGLSFNLDSLFDNPNYDMVIDTFQYEDLRVLRSIPYAKHGHWFKEGDLFEKFNGISSYLETIKPIAQKYAEAKRSGKQSEYWSLWQSDYPKTYSMIELNEKEINFIKRVDLEIEKRNQNRYVNNKGLKLLNVDLSENLNYLQLSDTSAYLLLGNNNFCISETRAEQMFNPYEYYHGLPHYITTDLYLSAYNAYLAWLIQYVEENEILPQLRVFTNTMLEQSLKELETCTDNEIRPLVEHSVVYYAIANTLFNEIPKAKNNNEEDYTSESNEKIKLPENLREIYNKELKYIYAETDVDISKFLGVQMLYSLFKPRGFYTRNDDTKMYFRGMMWLQNAKYRMKNLNTPLYLALQYNRSNPSLKSKMEKMNNLLTYLIGDIDNCSIMDLSKRLNSDFGIKSDADIKDQYKQSLVKDYLIKENKKMQQNI